MSAAANAREGLGGGWCSTSDAEKIGQGRRRHRQPISVFPAYGPRCRRDLRRVGGRPPHEAVATEVAAGPPAARRRAGPTSPGITSPVPFLDTTAWSCGNKVDGGQTPPAPTWSPRGPSCPTCWTVGWGRHRETCPRCPRKRGGGVFGKVAPTRRPKGRRPSDSPRPWPREVAQQRCVTVQRRHPPAPSTPASRVGSTERGKKPNSPATFPIGPGWRPPTKVAARHHLPVQRRRQLPHRQPPSTSTAAATSTEPRSPMVV